jgi:hypothetical protein
MRAIVARLCGAALALTGACALLAALALAQGRTLPDADAAYWRAFGLAGCALPCFAGITPGETPFSDVVGLISESVPALSQQLLVSNSQVVFFAEDSALQTSLSGVVRYHQGSVGEIRLSLYLPLSSIVLRYGTPNCTLLYSAATPSEMYLYWQAGDLLYWASVGITDRVRLSSPVYTLASTELEAPDVCHTRPETRAWRGFVPVPRMLTDDRAGG